jgi:hypothetical protein
MVKLNSPQGSIVSTLIFSILTHWIGALLARQRGIACVVIAGPMMFVGTVGVASMGFPASQGSPLLEALAYFGTVLFGIVRTTLPWLTGAVIVYMGSLINQRMPWSRKAGA